MDKSFEEYGVFKFNDEWATQIQFEARMIEKTPQMINIHFKNGRNTIGSLNGLDRKEAIDLIGLENFHTIESQVRVAHDLSEGDIFKGKLEGKQLAFKETLTPDYEINTIEPLRTLDREALERSELLLKHREKIATKQRNDQTQQKDESLVDAVIDDHKEKNNNSQTPASVDQDAIPDSVKKQFLQVKKNFYFKDETLAFIDNGPLLRARVEHKEVVKALVSIALKRDWDAITIKGSSAFRQAVWMEANLRGLKTAGYVPSELDKVKLAELQKKKALDPTQQTEVENTIQKGIDKTKESKIDNSSLARNDVSEPAKEKGIDKTEGSKIDNSSLARNDVPEPAKEGVLRRYVGKVKEHGPAKYEFDEKHEKLNYFVKLDTDDGEKIIWGVDLKRAMQETVPTTGEKVTIDYLGNHPVTVQEPIFDEKGNKVAEQEVHTHRNTWCVTREQNRQKAQTFKEVDAKDGVQQHPELMGAYTVKEVAKKFVAERMANHSEASKSALVKMTEEFLAKHIEDGKDLPPLEVRTERVNQLKEIVKSSQISKEPKKEREQEIDR